MQLASRLAPRLGAPATVNPFVSRLLHILEQQRVHVSADPVAAASRELYLFQRLSPMLLLRVLPHTALASEPVLLLWKQRAQRTCGRVHMRTG